MPYNNRQRILDFFAAFYAMDLDRAMAFYSESVDYVSFAPIDIIPHLGHRHSKAQLRETFAAVYSRYESMRYEVLSIVAEDDRVATIVRVFLQKINRDRIVQLDIANFYKLQDGLIVQQREFFDSYDLVQQVLEVDIGAAIAKIRA